MDADGPYLIDAHAQLGPWPRTASGHADAEALLAELDRVGIAEAIVTHIGAWLHEPATGNRWLVEAAAGTSRLWPCWVLIPGATDESPPPERLLGEATEHGVVAFRGYPTDHGWRLNGAGTAPYWHAFAKARIPLFVDAAQTSWREIEECARTHPELRLVICQVGYRALRSIAGLLTSCANVWLDTAHLSTHEGLEWLVERFGHQRLVLGTALPEHDPAEAVTRLLWSGLDTTAVSAIGAGNLRRLLSATEAA